MKIIVLGGYGNFGARICQALAGNAHIELIIAGRNLQKASNFAAQLNSSVKALALDIEAPELAATFRQHDIGLVIHTAGPFQQQDYHVALAAAEAGSHYIDLADGRRFVCDFQPALDTHFSRSKRLAITGASTVPALSSAVVNHLTARWKKIDRIDCCIAPAHTAPRGLATMRAILSYCGQAISVWQDNQWVTQYGWAQPKRIQFARLRTRLGALCDIPDLELFPNYYAGVNSVMFRAALEISLGQRALAGLAFLHRQKLIDDPCRYAELMESAATKLNCFGSSLGGMVLRVQGLDEHGVPRSRAWHITADNDHGPEIPCMAAILLARKLAEGNIRETGASVCMNWLHLSDFAPEFARWNMQTDICEEALAYGS